MEVDSAVQATNDDCSACKLSAIKAGYYEDEFLHFFVKNFTPRRSPLINRGYYARVTAIRNIVIEFLNFHKSQPCQIISLGAGFDTLFFHLKSKGLISAEHCVYYEFDCSRVSRRKATVIRKTKTLLDLLETVEPSTSPQSNIELHSEAYHLISGDLRSLDNFQKRLLDAGLDPNKPTLILAECVLNYLYPPEADAIIHWASSKFQHSVFVSYEQIRPDDPFGKMMCTNIKNRGCPLLSIEQYPNLQDQVLRFQSAGYDTVASEDMLTVYNQWIPALSRASIERLEMLDELEEWALMLQHYCISVASFSKSSSATAEQPITGRSFFPSFVAAKSKS
eukprot:GCRY01002758.1.p1 GENE.GCRY01002758.1~~GCRY01002758.1.p1  ORF type:complete len:336 (-),score=22.56 GCRY01002758.1:138-1145(-)